MNSSEEQEDWIWDLSEIDKDLHKLKKTDMSPTDSCLFRYYLMLWLSDR